MRRKLCDPNLCSVAPHNGPDDVGSKSIAVNATTLVDGPEDAAVGETGRSRPLVDPQLDPARHRNGASSSSLPQDVDDDPAAFALLDLLDGEPDELVAAKTTAEKQSQDGAIAL